MAFGSIYQGGTYLDESKKSVMAVFKSLNNGTNWERYMLTAETGEVHAIAVAASNTDIVYAGGRYDPEENWQWHAKLFKTTNGGAEWFGTGADINASNITSLLIDPENSSRIYAGTERGVYVSSDGGTSWTEPSLNSTVRCIVLDPANRLKLFMGTSNGVYQSLDGGESWNQINNGLTNMDVQSMDFDAANGILYAGTNGGGVFRYTVSTNVEEEIISDAMPSGFALYQNFPNPFNAVTEIRYDLAESGHVDLAVYDLKGRRVKTLVNSAQSAGGRSVKWNAVNDSGVESASGIYILRLRTSNQVISKKIVLQK